MFRILASLTGAFVIALAGAGSAAARTINLETYPFDPAVGTPALPADLTLAPGDDLEFGYFLVQTDGPITPEWRGALEGCGATIYGYVDQFAFLVGMNAAAQQRVRALPATAWMGPYQPAYKLSPNIGLQVFVSPDRLRDPNLTLMVRVFRDLDGVAERIARLGGTVLDRTDDGFSRRLVVHIPREGLHAIARIPHVWWIEEKPEFRVMNNTTRWVVQSNASGSTPIWDQGIHGDGQIATLMDTGVDYNSCWFRDSGNAPPGPSHRKIIDYTTFGTGAPYDGCDTGHGSHVAGTIAGDQSFINPGNLNYNGMAYKAKLTVQDVGADDWAACNLGTVGVPGSLTAAFNASFGLGARVHSNSWGSTSNSYDSYCVDVDNAMWSHPDFLICFAAGNSGPGGSSVGSPGTAKDLVTAGASQQAPNQETVASYSSRGPSADGRLKPTVMAPGGEDPIFITSVDNNPGDPPTPTCQTASSPFQGTSMATPAIAGSALNLRQYYMDGFYPAGAAGGDPLVPSAALIKATLINSTDDMGAADIPNNNEGWGRILLDNALYFEGDTRELKVQDNRTGLNTGGIWSDDLSIDASNEPLVITLVWTDYPATSGSNAPLINDLDLLVTAPNGSQYKGNVFSGGFSTTGGSPDRKNVEEAVRIQSPAPGTWTVRVSGYNVPHAPQPFAVALNGAFANWPPGNSAVERRPAAALPFVHAYPNPVTSILSLRYAVPAGYRGPIRLEIVDVQGRLVRSLVHKGQASGEYRVTWRTEDEWGRVVPGGVYFARFTVGSQAVRTKVVVQR